MNGSGLYSLESFYKARGLHNRGKNPRHGRQNDLESETTSSSLSWISLCHDCCSAEPGQIRPRGDRIPVRRSRWDEDSLSHRRPRARGDPSPWLHPDLADVAALDSKAHG